MRKPMRVVTAAQARWARDIPNRGHGRCTPAPDVRIFHLGFRVRGKGMRGAGPVRWGNEVVYCYFTTSAGVTRVRLSADEADRLDVVEGLRVRLALPGAEPFDGLVERVRREPPFAWVELTPLRPAEAVNRAG